MHGPAIEKGDTAFTRFTERCLQSVDPVDPGGTRDRIAEETARFAQSWRIADPRYCRPQPDAPYGSYLLFSDPASGFTAVLDIFMPGQVAAIHNHRTWGVFVCLEGREIERVYAVPEDLSAPPEEVFVQEAGQGMVRTADACHNAFHQVETTDATSVSLHLYGADIGRIEREIWNPEAARYESFCSGYSNDILKLPPYLRFA